MEGRDGKVSLERVARWFRTTKDRDVSTVPFARPLARSLSPLTHSLSPYCSLRSPAFGMGEEVGGGGADGWGVDASEVWRDQTCSIMLSLMWLQCASATTSFSSSLVFDRL